MPTEINVVGGSEGVESRESGSNAVDQISPNGRPAVPVEHDRTPHRTKSPGTVLVAHTNENEFNTFVANKKNEALKDRMILIRVPYNLRVSDEVRIYEKLLADSALKDVHIAPHTLRIASMFAILTRLEPSKKAGMSLMKKLKLYNGDSVEGFTAKDIKELQEEAQREGMQGISPGYIPDLHRV